MQNSRAARFPACVISLENFQTLGELKRHEKVRDAGMMELYDTFQDFVHFVHSHPVVFVSHQWLAFDEPDPNKVHYNAIIDACAMLIDREGLDPKKVHLWIDYISIPQVNKHTQLLAIQSL